MYWVIRMPLRAPYQMFIGWMPRTHLEEKPHVLSKEGAESVFFRWAFKRNEVFAIIVQCLAGAHETGKVCGAAVTIHEIISEGLVCLFGWLVQIQNRRLEQQGLLCS